MDSLRHVPAGYGRGPGSSSSGSGFSDLAPQIQQQLYRRLGGMGLLYAGAWAANYVYHRTLHPPEAIEIEFNWHLVTGVCVAAGLALYLACRRQSIPPRNFADVAMAVEVLGGIGIQLGFFYWLQNGEMILNAIAEALGMGAGNVMPELVQPLDAVGLRLLYSEGVTWVSVWLLTFPLVVPMPMARTVVATLLTAATAPAILALGAYVTGVPESSGTWAIAYALDVTIPTFICAAIAIFGASVVYRLTRDLSHAQRMGNYELVDRIGAGGMGEVWRARHRLLARPAAIKLIRPDVLNEDDDLARTAIRRFEREVQQTTRLKNPHTITIYDYGQTDEGTFYYVMELLDGIDLESFVKRFGPVDAGRAIHWMRQACSSLAEAHARGLIHRDVKPANLFSCRYGLETDFLKVLDFGLVWQEHGAGIEELRITREHSATGTPAYMAPEVAVGAGADARSDVYALGCVVYWLLTGFVVFEGDTAMQVVVQHASAEPVPPSRRTELEVPADLESVVLDCLAKDPASRPQSVSELESRLAACGMAGSWSSEASRRWWETHMPVPDLDSGDDPAIAPAVP